MSPQEKARVKRDADKGDASAQRLLDFVAAMEDTIERARGASAARMLIGEHDDVYGGLIDEMLGGLIPAILVAADIMTMAEFIESMRWYIPREKGGEV